MINVGVALSIQNIGNIQFQGSGVLMHRSISDDVHDYGLGSFGEEDNILYFESSTKLVCTNSSGIAFKWIDNLSLKNITILNCGSYSPWPWTTAAVHMLNIYNLTVDGLTIRNSTGYGLLGVNVLGTSIITRSSIVGSNQNVFRTFGEENCILNCPIAGGNLVLRYSDIGGDSIVHTSDTTHYMTILDGLFTLGLDIASRRNSNNTGSGVAILFNQHTYRISVVINDSISYRNHAYDGPNLKFIVETSAYNLTLCNISSMRGESTINEGTSLFFMLTFQNEDITMGNFHIKDSKFRNSHIFISLSGVHNTVLVQGCQFFNANITIINNSKNSLCFTTLKGITMQNTCLQISHLFQTKLTSIIALESSIVANNSMLELSGNNQFIGGKLQTNRSSPLTLYSSTVQIYGNSEFLNCNAHIGGAVYMESKSRINVYKLSNVTFSNNQAHKYGGAVYMISGSVIFIESRCKLAFISNKANINGGAIYMHNSYLISDHSDIAFIKNIAYISGGAIAMDPNSYLQFKYLSFQQNTAYISGGAIFVQDTPPTEDIDGANHCNLNLKGKREEMYFEENYAGEAGSVLYGGNIESCGNDEKTFSKIAKIGYHDNSTSIISSDPKYICPCNDTTTGIGIDQCLVTYLNTSAYPGQNKVVKFITIGQMGGASPTIVLNFMIGDDGISFISATRSSKMCEEHNIPLAFVNSTQYLVTRNLFTTGDIFKSPSHFNIAVAILPCPVGFVLCTVSMVCICDPLLTKSGLTCNITDVTVRGTQNTWIGYTSQHVLGFCTVCPYDYCIEAAEVNVLDLDSQCGYGRHRVLCGQCKDGQSMSFGTSQCKVCTNYYLFMIVPFAIMGITLVIVLFLLNLTVTSGTLNGLLFYANIVRINDSIFFPKANRYFAAQFLRTFVAWLNLDFGIETCFYDRMDSYAKTWMQFAFPAYIFAILGAIIIAGRCSSKISRLCRHHAIPVLSTLILLSYSKMLKTIITIFSYAVIKTDVNSTGDSLVWLYDGNIEFLGPKHVILFTFGLLVIFTFIVPYTTMLLFLPCLQSKSYMKALIWVNKLKPFLDSYAAPYKDRYRFWVGVLLLVRLPLYLLFSSTNNISVHLLGILIFVYIYSMFLIRLAVYKKWTTFAIDLFFQLNIISISTARLFDHGKSIHEPIASIVLVGVASAMLCLVLIVVTHIYLRLEKVLPSLKVCQHILVYWTGKETVISVKYNSTCTSPDELREALLQDV